MPYPGGKAGAGVYQKIINLMPPHRAYIEPFLGGGAIMRAKRPAQINVGIDLHEPAIRAFQPGGFGANGDGRRRSSPEMVDSAALANLGDSGSGIAYDDEGSSYRLLVADGIEYLELASSVSTVEASTVRNGERRRSPKSAMSDRLTPEVVRLQDNDLVYCDPPYLMSTRSGKRLYAHELSSIEHRRLLRVVMELPCMVMISGYWSEMYAEVLAGWKHTTFQAMTRAGKMATEWLWFNFPEPIELHDYRYLGDGFRERERIQRKTKRWAARLKRMPKLERQALLAAMR